MPGYPRPAPAFRWFNWWVPMGLMREEVDDWAVLEAEDVSILSDTTAPDDAPDMARLTEILADGRATPLHETAEGDGGPRGGHDQHAGGSAGERRP